MAGSHAAQSAPLDDAPWFLLGRSFPQTERLHCRGGGGHFFSLSSQWRLTAIGCSDRRALLLQLTLCFSSYRRMNDVGTFCRYLSCYVLRALSHGQGLPEKLLTLLIVRDQPPVSNRFVDGRRSGYDAQRMLYRSGRCWLFCGEFILRGDL